MKMTDYQIDLVVSKYFEVLIEKNIKEDEVKDFFQKDGVLNIVLEDNKIIQEKIKNFYN